MLSLPAKGKGRIKTRRYSRGGLTGAMMVAGPPSTMHQSAHGKPNAAKRSARGRCNPSMVVQEVVVQDRTQRVGCGADQEPAIVALDNQV